MRLDHRSDRQRLEHTVQRIRPRLVLLDPLVRLHGVDENAVAEVAPILGILRDLQRRFETAVLLVHHSRKSGATRPGQAGSWELHSWGNSNLYLRRRDNQIAVEIALADDGQEPALRLRRQIPDKAEPAWESGVYVQVDVGTLVDEIVLSPLATPAFRELAPAVLDLYEIGKKLTVKESSITGIPVWCGPERRIYEPKECRRCQ